MCYGAMTTATVLVIDPFGQYSGYASGTAMPLKEHLWNIHPVIPPPDLRPMPPGRTRKCNERPAGLPPLPRMDRLPVRSPRIFLSRKVEIPRARSRC